MLTDIERKALQGILDSDYMDGMTEEVYVVNHAVWAWSCSGAFANKKQFSGAISSLTKKGYVKADSYGSTKEEDTLQITKEGFDAYRSHT